MSLYSACDKNPDPGKDDFGPDPSCGMIHRRSLMSWHLFAAVCKKTKINNMKMDESSKFQNPVF